MPYRFTLVSRWQLEISAAAIWQLLTDTDAWPTWWSRVRSVKRAASSPIGDVAHLHWRSALPFGTQLRLTTIGVDRLQWIESHAQGDVQGTGTWLLEPAEGGWVAVSYRWEVLLERRWMRALSILLRPLFEWNHFTGMRAASVGMGRQLGCRMLPLSEWTGSRWP